MDNMDLTNLNSTLSSDAENELFQRELAAYESAQEITVEELKKICCKHLDCKTAYEENLFKIAEMQKANDLAYSEMEAITISEINREAKDLKIVIALSETRLDHLKVTKKVEVNELMITLAELESLRAPTPEDSTLDPELIDMMEQNAKLKEDLGLLNAELDEKDMMVFQCHEKVTSLESELAQLKQHLLEQQQTLKENKVIFQEKYDEKFRLQSLLNQMKPLTEKNKQGSLFDEVIDKTSDLATKYELLKKKYIKAKDVLAQNNAEISKIKTDSMKHKNVLGELRKKRIDLVKDLSFHENKRIEDLQNSIRLMKRKIENSKKMEPVTISTRNISDVRYYAKTAQKEVERAQEEINNILAYKLPLEQRLFRCEHNLIRTGKELKHLIDMNSELEHKIKQYQGDNQSSDIPMENARKIRFADDVKFIDEN